MYVYTSIENNAVLHALWTLGAAWKDVHSCKTIRCKDVQKTSKIRDFWTSLGSGTDYSCFETRNIWIAWSSNRAGLGFPSRAETWTVSGSDARIVGRGTKRLPPLRPTVVSHYALPSFPTFFPSHCTPAYPYPCPCARQPKGTVKHVQQRALRAEHRAQRKSRPHICNARPNLHLRPSKQIGFYGETRTSAAQMFVESEKQAITRKRE